MQNSAISQRLDEFVTLINKIIEIKESRGRQANLISIINEIERDPDLTDRVHNQIDVCRANLWREICTFTKNYLQLVVGPTLFY